MVTVSQKKLFPTYRRARFPNTRRTRRTRSTLETYMTLHIQVSKFSKRNHQKADTNYSWIIHTLYITSFTFGPGSPIPISPWSPGGPGNPRSPCEHMHGNYWKLPCWCTRNDLFITDWSCLRRRAIFACKQYFFLFSHKYKTKKKDI